MIDLVFFTDRELLAALREMKASDYFVRRDGLARDFPGGFITQSFELMPGQTTTVYDIGSPCHPVGTLLFVNYANGATNRIMVETRAMAGTLKLGPEQFTWRGQ